MRKRIIIALAAIMIIAGACSRGKPGDMVSVEGGIFINTKSNYHGKGVTIKDFFIGRYEVTQKEWLEVMGSNPSKFKGDNASLETLPVESVSWYECVEYCNMKSLKEGFRPYYRIDKDKKDPFNRNMNDDMQWTVTINEGADGYRLPTEAEWEYAAGGGRKSGSFTYSGSDNLDAVAWFWKNSGDKPLDGFWAWPNLEGNNNRTKAVGGKAPNELGLYDMSGNVREWCWDWHDPKAEPARQGRVWRGGGWIGIDYPCATSFRGGPYEANARGTDQGFRVCRSRTGT